MRKIVLLQVKDHPVLQTTKLKIVKVKMKNPHRMRGRELRKVDGYQELQQNLKMNIESLQENLYENFKHLSGRI